MKRQPKSVNKYAKDVRTPKYKMRVVPNKKRKQKNHDYKNSDY